MISSPGAAMLDSKLFISRFTDPFPDLYERYWDGVEWIWINHGRPNGIKMKGTPGAAMMNEKLFVVVDDGSLWERHWRTDLGSWVWFDHGRPQNRKIIHGPGAEMMNEKLFVVTDDGTLWERHWRTDLNSWVWFEHGRPGNQKIIAAPGAAMMNSKFFVVTEAGNLWERHWRPDLGSWVWEDHGRPNNEKIIAEPGAAMMDEKLFVTTEAGNLWERHWRTDLGRWAWNSHGNPGVKVTGAPGAAITNSRLFMATEDGHLWERNWGGNNWNWIDHGMPGAAKIIGRPGATMMDIKFFAAADNDHLFERAWTGTEWKWVDHGTPYHDQSAHVIGAPGSTPKMTIAVMGDGFAENDLDEYKKLVNDKVVEAFKLDVLGDNFNKFRVIRIDVVSPVSGVTTRNYNEMGTPTPIDDVLTKEDFKYSRLGLISTGIWSHCWIESSAYTIQRIDSLRKRFATAATNVIILINDTKYGGCSVGAFAAFTKISEASVVAHEMGHNLFALGDEYNNDTRNFTGIAGQPNLTEQPTNWNSLKWAALVAPGTPLPTNPAALPAGWSNQTSVGAFEGGNANFSTGVFRPVLECRMNQNNPPFCPVCAAEINRIMQAFI